MNPLLHPSQDVILAVQKRRESNVLTPIFKLSDDLLSILFSYFDSSVGSVEGLTDIISVSQVCYLWRVVALDLPTLWRYVEFTQDSIQWGKELLRRSSRARFILLYCAKGTSDEAIISNPGIGLRIRQFGGHISDQAWTLLCDEAQHPEAQLQRLSLIHPKRCFGAAPESDDSDAEDWDDTHRLPPVIFKGHAPPLRKVSLARCYVDLRSPFFENVTVLHLNITEPCQLSITEFSSAMEHMPSLEKLHIYHALLPLPPGHLPIVAIPKLQYFHTFDNNDDLDRLIAQLSIPKSCILDLHGLQPNAMENTRKALIDRIIFDYRNNGNVSLNMRNDLFGLSIDNNPFMDPGMRDIRSSFDSLKINLWFSNGEDDNGDAIDNYHDFVPIFDAFTSALEEVPLNIIFLTLGMSKYKAEILPSLLRFQRVQHLRLAESWQDTLSILQLEFIPNAESVGRLLFPSLKTIVVTPPMAKNPECAEEFISLLRWRSGIFAPIIRLDYEYWGGIEMDTGDLFRDKIQDACPDVEVKMIKKSVNDPSLWE